MKVRIDWRKVEKAMRESITGRGTEEGHLLCQKAYRADPKRYTALHQQTKGDEFEAEKAKWRLR